MFTILFPGMCNLSHVAYRLPILYFFLTQKTCLLDKDLRPPSNPPHPTTASSPITTIGTSEPNTPNSPKPLSPSLPKHALLLLLLVSCFLASFMDTVKASDRKVYHGLANFKEMWIFDYMNSSGFGLPDLSNYRVRFIDFVHTLLSVWVLL